MKLFLLLTVAVTAIAQSSPVSAPAAPGSPSSFLATMTDPLMLSLAAYDLSQVAQGASAWKFTAAGKTYHVSAAQQTGIAAAATIGAAAIAHKWPRMKTPLTIILGAASAYYGGLAYYQVQNHGAPATTATPAPPVASVRFRK